MSANEPQMQPTAPTPPAAPPPATPPYSPARRSPGLAVLLSCIPGLGHLYLGLYQRGVAFFVAAVTVIYIGEGAHLGPLLGFFVWGFAFIDAYRQAVTLNLCCETGTMPEPVTLPKQRGSLGFGVFLLVLGSLLLYNQFYPLDLTFLVDWWPMGLVLAGAYLLAKHFIEQKKLREAERPPESF